MTTKTGPGPAKPSPRGNPTKPAQKPRQRRPLRAESALPCLLCLCPGFASRLILIPPPGATPFELAVLNRITVHIDRAVSAGDVYARLLAAIDAETREIRH
jgi:hypothetical protein